MTTPTPTTERREDQKAMSNIPEEQIRKGNELIAEFRGWIKSQDPAIHEYEMQYLDYHKNWNELMYVVERVEAIHDSHHGYFGVHISSNGCSIQGTKLHMAINDSSYGYVYMSDPNAVFHTKIESTWYNIVEFIKWYNKQTKP